MNNVFICNTTTFAIHTHAHTHTAVTFPPSKCPPSYRPRDEPIVDPDHRIVAPHKALPAHHRMSRRRQCSELIDEPKPALVSVGDAVFPAVPRSRRFPHPQLGMRSGSLLDTLYLTGHHARKIKPRWVKNLRLGGKRWGSWGQGGGRNEEQGVRTGRTTVRTGRMGRMKKKGRWKDKRLWILTLVVCVVVVRGW